MSIFTPFNKHLISLTPWSSVLSLEAHIWLLGYEAFLKVTSIAKQSNLLSLMRVIMFNIKRVFQCEEN